MPIVHTFKEIKSFRIHALRPGGLKAIYALLLAFHPEHFTYEIFLYLKVAVVYGILGCTACHAVDECLILVLLGI